MAQLDFEYNFPNINRSISGINAVSLTFVPFHIRDSISWSIFNMPITYQATDTTHAQSLSVGLYTLNGSTLSLMNSISGTNTFSTANIGRFISLTATSATQNLTPGNYWFGILLSTSNGTSRLSIWGASLPSANNAFPVGFVGGAMTASTNALPTAYSTSDLDTTGIDGLLIPYILLTT